MNPASDAVTINAPLRAHRAFMRFWCARLASTAANQMLMVAIGWQLYSLTGRSGVAALFRVTNHG